MFKSKFSISFLIALFLCLLIPLVHDFIFVDYYIVIILISVGLFFHFYWIDRFVFSVNNLLIYVLFTVFIFYFVFKIDGDLSAIWEVEIRNNILLAAVLCFCCFLIYSLHSYSKKAILISFFSSLSLLYLTIFWLRVMVSYSEFRAGNNLWAGLLTVMLAPVAAIPLFKDFPLKGFSFLLILFLLLVSISSRAASLSVALFILCFFFYPLLTKHKILYYSILPIFFFVIYMGILLYIEAHNYQWATFVDNLSLSLFDKSLFSGRNYIWKELIDIIHEKPWDGYGTYVLSKDFVSETKSWRNLSSHNTYLEIALRGGYIGLIIFLGLLWSIWGQFYSKNNLLLKRVAAAGFIAVLFNMVFAEFLLFQNLAANAIIWSFWGLAIGKNSGEDIKKIERS